MPAELPSEALAQVRSAVARRVHLFESHLQCLYGAFQTGLDARQPTIHWVKGCARAVQMR